MKLPCKEYHHQKIYFVKGRDDDANYDAHDSERL